MSTTTETNKDDVIVATDSNDIINSGNGSDTVDGGGGNDVINGGNGDDVLSGGAGDDVVSGGRGDDTLIYILSENLTEGTNDLYVGGSGVDTVRVVLTAEQYADFGVQAQIAAYEAHLANTSNGSASDFTFTFEIGGEVATLTVSMMETLELVVEPAAQNVDTSGNEDTVIEVVLAGADTDGTIASYMLTSLPSDGTLYLDAATTIEADVGVAYASDTFYFKPDGNFSGEVSFTYTVTDDGGVSDATPATASITVNAVADTPDLSVTDATGFEDEEIPLSIQTNLTDLDGSETLSITISGVPVGAVLSEGIDNNDGTWTLTRDQLSELTITPPPDSEDSFDLTVTATSTDGSSSAIATATIHVTVIPVSDESVQQGYVLDGYIVGATVFADANEDGVFDAGEAYTTTGADGQFTLVGGSGPLVMFGGTDISTGLAFTGTLSAPEGSSTITPLTTLIQTLVAADPLLSTDDAEALVQNALGLTGEVDLTDFDPIAAAFDADTDNDALAISVFAAGVQVQNTITMAASLLDGDNNVGDTNYQQATAAVLSALAAQIELGAVDLSDANDIDILLMSADEAYLPRELSAGDIDNATQIVSESNQAVDFAVTDNTGVTDTLTGIVGVAIVAQEDTAAALLDGNASATDLSANTGAALDAAVTSAENEVGIIGGAIVGTAGNDVLLGDDGGPRQDAIQGLAGNDLLSGGAENDFLSGGAGRDTLNGGDGDDQLFGGAGDDVLIGGLGDDLLDGGENGSSPLKDQDKADYSSNDDFLDAGVVVNLATGFADDGLGGTDTLVNMEGAIGTKYDDIFYAGDPTNFATNRAETFEGRGGNDEIHGGSDLTGSYNASYQGAADGIYLNLGPTIIHTDSVQIVGGTAQDGDGGVDTLFNINRITGSQHDDVIYGSDSTIGNERFTGLFGDDYINGRGGIDYVMYANAPGAVVLNFSNTVLGSGNASDGYGTTDTFENIEGVRGSNFGDTLNGSDLQAERFEGMGGNDTINGGAFNDRVEFGQSPTGAVVNLSNTNFAVGAVIALANTAQDGFGGVDQLNSIEQVNGSRLDDYIIANAGTVNNRFDGSEGIDTVSYAAATVNTSVNLNTLTGQNTGSGTDTLLNVENLVGSDFFDNLTGNAAANWLIGGEQDDTLIGGAGNDILDGGENPGGQSADSDLVNYNVAGVSQGAMVNLATGAASNDGFGTSDTLRNIERVTGTSFDDVLTGGDVSNFGSGTSEQFEGLAGNDTITGGGIVAGASTFAVYTNAPTGVKVNLRDNDIDLGEGVTLFAHTGLDGYDAGIVGPYGYTDTLVNINRVRGSAHGDLFYGSDSLIRDERFEGRAGADSIHGGGGIDWLFYSSSARGVTVDLGISGTNGSGTVVDDGFGVTGSIDIFTGIEAVRGSNFDDTLIGSDSTDVIERFEGMNGNDTITGGLGADRVEYGQSDFGVIVNLASGTASGGAGADTLSGIEQVTGSRLNDTITGDAVANILDGSGGDDVLVGREGNDTLIGGENLGDQITDSDTASYNTGGVLNGAVVSLAAGIAYNDGFGNIDTLVSIERIRGTIFADTLTGGDPTNINTGRSEQLDGRQGDDILTGGSIAAGFSTFSVYSNSPMGVKVNLSDDDIGLGGGVILLAGTAFDGYDAGIIGTAGVLVGPYGYVDTLVNINRIIGSNHGDLIQGSDSTTGSERFDGRAGADTIHGGGGTDWIFYSAADTRGVTVDLGVSGTPGMGTVVDDGFGAVGSTDTFTGIEGVRGSNFSDLLVGSDRADMTEFFEGMGGNDIIDGKGGIDRVEFGQAQSGVTVNLDTGSAFDGAGGADTLSNIEQVRGSFLDDSLTGDAGANRLDGSDGDDILVGRGGNDLLIGGNEVDTFKWNFGDHGTEVTPAVDTITDFDQTMLPGTDKLDLKDLLVGEHSDAEILDDFLAFSFDGDDTTIDVRSTGELGPVDQKIVLQNVDLTAGGLNDQQIITNLLNASKLITDV